MSSKERSKTVSRASIDGWFITGEAAEKRPSTAEKQQVQVGPSTRGGRK